MRSFTLCLATLLLAACTRPPAAIPGGPAQTVESLPVQTAALRDLHTRYEVDALRSRKFTHAQLWDALGPIADAVPHVTREEIGRSAEGRPLYLLRFGSGPTRVLLWSQMHGDEPTATMALADLFNLFATAPTDERVRRIADRLTIAAIPMLNPDGAEDFERRNAFGIDINRDARALATPEARALREAHRRFDPQFGFNLHDQNVRTRIGRSDRLAAIALLAPPPDASGAGGQSFARAQQLAATLRNLAEPMVAGHIARYDDTFNPRAFGDLMQSWGTSTVLIESGGWTGDPEKQYLRMVNFVMLLAALDAIATGDYTSADPAAYLSLPENGRAVNDLLIRGGTLAMPGLAPVRADVAIDFDDPLAQLGGRIADIGDLADAGARDTLDAAGLFLHPAPAPAGPVAGGATRLVIDEPASFDIRSSADAASPVVWTVRDGVVQRSATQPERR